MDTDLSPHRKTLATSEVVIRTGFFTPGQIEKQGMLQALDNQRLIQHVKCPLRTVWFESASQHAAAVFAQEQAETQRLTPQLRNQQRIFPNLINETMLSRNIQGAAGQKNGAN